jgi:single-stranded DNA-binding protein
VLRAHEGRAVVNMRLANTPRVPDGHGGFKDGNQVFLDLVALGTLAEIPRGR